MPTKEFSHEIIPNCAYFLYKFLYTLFFIYFVYGMFTFARLRKLGNGS